MKPHEEARDELVGQWIEKAHLDLDVACNLVSQGARFFPAAAFHAQQAAEKYLKALLVHHQIEFPRTHDLGELLDLLAPVEGPLVSLLAEATALNPYSVDMRYPGEMPEISDGEAKQATELARAVRDAVLTALANRP